MKENNWFSLRSLRLKRKLLSYFKYIKVVNIGIEGMFKLQDMMIAPEQLSIKLVNAERTITALKFCDSSPAGLVGLRSCIGFGWYLFICQNNLRLWRLQRTKIDDFKM